MNRENLKKIADHILTVPQGKFGMLRFREDQSNTIECNSVGCVIGHSLVLDPNPNQIPKIVGNAIDYEEWSVQFTGLDLYSPEWCWCFADSWAYVDNTVKGASKRINWLLDHGLPRDCQEQMEGDADLCYK